MSNCCNLKLSVPKRRSSQPLHCSFINLFSNFNDKKRKSESVSFSLPQSEKEGYSIIETCSVCGLNQVGCEQISCGHKICSECMKIWANEMKCDWCPECGLALHQTD